MCEAANIPNAIGSMPETGIGTAAQIHLGIAMSNLQYASDCCGSLYYDHDFLKKPLKIIKGRAYPPQGPGLGIELDNNISHPCEESINYDADQYVFKNHFNGKYNFWPWRFIYIIKILINEPLTFLLKIKKFYKK